MNPGASGAPRVAAGSRRRIGSGRRALVLLLLALATVFVSGGDRGRFYLGAPDLDHLTRNHLTVVANLSPEHGFLGFYHQYLNEDGETAYRAYNRFPLGGHLLIKAAIAPFPGDPPAQLRAARTLMLALLAAAAVTAFLSLRRLTSSSGVALAATLLSFASFYPLFYGDMVATEGSLDLFAVLLTFHGMVVFTQEGRFRQLLAKTCGALLVGWHVYGLLPPFIVFGLAGEWRRGSGSRRSRVARLARSRHLALGVVALTFGLSVLTFNFAREYAALTSGGAPAQGDTAALAELPSFQAMARRLGWDPDFNAETSGDAWRPLLGKLVQRAGRASTPYGAERVAGFRFGGRPGGEGGGGRPVERPERGERSSPGLRETAAFAWGSVVIFLCAAGLTRVRHRVLMATLAASGFCWGALVRGSVNESNEALFLVGLPLVFFSVALLQARRVSERSIGVCAGAALLVFVLSGLQMGRLRADVEASDFRVEAADYEMIRAVAPEGAVILSGGAERWLARFFLTGRIFVGSANGRQRRRADFVLSRERLAAGAGLLTPDNRRMFLYDRTVYDAQYAALGDPALEGGRGWRVHLVGGRLIYTAGAACGTGGRFRNAPPFFLEVLDFEGRALARREFSFRSSGFEVAGRCMAEISIPGYDAAARVRTGQFVRGAGPLWSGEVPLPGGTHPARAAAR